MDLLKAIQRAANDRGKMIEELFSALEDQVAASQKELLMRIIEEWVDKLDLTDGNTVANTLKNKRLLQNLDDVFQRFTRNEGLAVAKTIAEGVGQVVNFNGKYYGLFTKQAQLIKIKPQVTEFTKAWLGLSGGGKLVENGYLSRLVQNTSVLTEVKNWALNSVISQQGFKSMKESLADMIQGNPEKLGALQRYYRNFVYDTYSQVDRATARTYANSLKLRYAIYEGGIIKTTRPFCRERNGKVFTEDEIKEMEPKEALPPNYNPFTDMGGYGCRHHWNWIPEAVAFALRPDLKNAA